MLDAQSIVTSPGSPASGDARERRRGEHKRQSGRHPCVPPKGASMTEIEEMGPVDYIVVEWPDRQPNGEALPLLVDLVESGIVRLLDIAFFTKDADGSVAALEI